MHSLVDSISCLRFLHAALLLWVMTRMACPCLLADWTTARGGNGRASWSAEGPGDRLEATWSVATGNPAPAWISEARGSLWQKISEPFVSRAGDDVAPQPILSAHTVLVATTLDEVRCLDRVSGRVLWSYWCGGPIRYAPAVAEGVVYVGSDDGKIRAINGSNGTLRWETRIGPDEPWIIGNGRLIPPHPIRTGLLVSDGIIYATAGLFPLEGTYLVALRVQDGSLVWRRTLNQTSPQGYLVDAGTSLIIPNGRADPKVHGKIDGAFRRDLASSHGTLAVALGDETYAGPGATGSFARSQPGAKVVSYPGRHLAVSPTTSFLVNDRELMALDRGVLRAESGNLPKAIRWKQPVVGASALIVAGSQVYVGWTNGVGIFEASTGKPGPVLSAPGVVAALAADTHSLIAVTREGIVQSYTAGGSQVPSPTLASLSNSILPSLANHPTPPNPSPVLTEVQKRLGFHRGWALWAETGDPRAFLSTGVAATEWSWVFAVQPAMAPSLRKSLADRGLLGRRAAVVELRPDGTVPTVDHLFNLVLSDGLSEAEARRLTCPAPSGVWIHQGRISTAPAASDVGRWTHQYGDAANTCSTRQSLTGTPRLRWFGGHGPERMPDRHTRGHAPLIAGGLVVSVAEDALIATDARNGTIRWTLATPGSMRYAMPYDGGYIVLNHDASRLWLAAGRTLWAVDAKEGRVERRIPSPDQALHWGWVAQSTEGSFASLLKPEAPRSLKEYDLVDTEYRSRRPLVCSQSLLRWNTETGDISWVEKASGAWVNPTLSVADGRVFAVEARGEAARTNRSGRLTCSEIVADARVVCLEASTGRRLWERSLIWPEAEDILGLGVREGRLFLSCARSVGNQAEYHLKCWDIQDGRERWQAAGRNPVEDLYHGQQVKRPVLLSRRISFESELYDITTGVRWKPPGAESDWILKRPGHACGGMTGTEDGLLFRADNPTWFSFTDGSFTRLSPTRPGCWLNILPVEGGVVIPEASASCICGYPIQASIGFTFGPTAPTSLNDLSTTP